MSEKSYAHEPYSIGELRADKEDSAAARTARDALIAVLRDIDNGAVMVRAVVICMDIVESKEGLYATNYQAGGKLNHYQAVGLVEATKNILLNQR